VVVGFYMFLNLLLPTEEEECLTQLDLELMSANAGL
jgi:hypothetical protein